MKPARVVTGLVGWAAGVFFEVERRGPPLPDGPVLVIANHLNALLDPLVLFRTLGRPTRPLAKAPLFQHPMVGPALRALGGLPVFRPRDDPEEVHRNETTFDAAIAALHAGDAIQIYPEGQSHSEPSLNPLRTGAARIALQAEEAAGWTLGLHVVPVGLVYLGKHLFRGSAVAVMGEPFALEGWRADYEADPRETVRRVTGEMERRLTAVTLNVPSSEDRVLLESAEAIYARGKGIASSRAPTPLGGRVPRLRAFAHGLTWLRTHDPDEYRRLRGRVARYQRMQDLLGSSRDRAVPERYDALGILRYALREGGTLVALLPAAAVASVAWLIPYHLPRLVVRAVDPAFDAIATYKLCAAILAFPLFLALWTLLAFLLAGPAWAVGVAIALPICGLLWIRWVDVWERVREDAAVFLRSRGRGSLRARLARMRSELVREFDRIGSTLPSSARREEGDAVRPPPG